jgi:hypothetical protein
MMLRDEHHALIRHFGLQIRERPLAEVGRSDRASTTRLTAQWIGSKQDSEHERVRHEQKWYEHGGNEVRGTLQAG